MRSRCYTQNDGTNLNMTFELMLIEYEIISVSEYKNKFKWVDMHVRVCVCAAREYVLCVKWQPMSSFWRLDGIYQTKKLHLYVFRRDIYSGVQQHIKYLYINHAMTWMTAAYTDTLVYSSEMYQKTKRRRRGRKKNV